MANTILVVVSEVSDGGGVVFPSICVNMLVAGIDLAPSAFTARTLARYWPE
jgi:hypothetical protein